MKVTTARMALFAAVAAGATAWSGTGAGAAPGVQPATETGEYQQIIDRYGEALVAVKLVLKFEGGGFGEGGERETETVGVMIDPKGVVMCSSLKTGGVPNRGGDMPTITPTDVKVLIADDAEGKPAKLITRDSELDLAWVKIDEPGEKPYVHVDLSKSESAVLGQRLFALDRMGKFFDRAPVISEGRVRGVAHRPRELYIPTEALVSDLGLPVFNAEGVVVGIVIVQVPDPESIGAGGGLFGEDGARPMILPAAEALKATQRALEAEAKPKEPKPAEAPPK
jgi:hypothetical protein